MALDRRDLRRSRATGTLLPGASADWQVVLPDGTALVDIRSTLLTDDGICCTSDHEACATGIPDVLARLGAW